jgi:hypothetical protein
MRRRWRLLIGAPPLPRRDPMPVDRPVRFESGVPFGPLPWQQVGRWWAPRWELRSEGRLFARFQPEDRCGHRFSVETSGARWLLRCHWLSRTHEITRQGESTPALRYRPSFFRGGRIERPAGEQLRWRTDFLGRRGTILDEGGFELLHVERTVALWRVHGQVRVEDAGHRLADIEPLMWLAWWLLLERRHRAAHGG